MVRLLKTVLSWAGAAGVLYAIVFAAVGVRSQERTLGLDQPKRFCGLYLDCHRMVQVAEVVKLDRIGDRTPQHTYWVVTVRYGSDAYGVDMRFSDLAAQMRTADGQWHRRDAVGEAALAAQGGVTGLPAMTLPGGHHFDTRIVFDVPAAAQPRLHIREDALLTRLSELFLLGDEDSFLHRRTFFGLSADTPTASVGDLSLTILAVETDTVTDTPYPVPADGVFYVVTLALTGADRVHARIVDRYGTVWHRARDVEAMLRDRPTEGHRLVFDVADGVVGPMLEIHPPGRFRSPIRIPLS